MDIQKSITDINKNIWVSASAGSGKTKVLIDRFIRLLIEGIDPRKIVCITFTKSAATEMLERINQTLSTWAICNEKTLKKHLVSILGKDPSKEICDRSRTLLTQILDTQHTLQIKTIHSFCQTILNKFPIESGIEINAQILEGSELEKIQFSAQKHTLSEYIETKFSKQIDTLISNVHDIKLSEIFEQILFITSQNPDFFSNIKTLQIYIDNLYKKFDIPIDFNFESHRKIVNSQILSTIQKSNLKLDKDISILKAVSEFKVSDPPQDLFQYFFTTLGPPKKHLINKKDSSEEILTLLTKIQNILLEFEQKHILFKTIKQTEGFLSLGHIFVDIYSKTKKRNQCLDYNDLLHHTIKLFDNPEVTQWIQYKLHYKIEHLLIDEAQDTNLLQWRIIDQLQKVFFQNNTDKKCTVFVVGDPKQSIYSFQGTSPEIFEGMKHLNMKSTQNWLDVQLNTSYRSDQLVLDFIDDTFNNLTKTSPNLFYTSSLKHSAFKEFDKASVELWPAILGLKSENTTDNAWQVLDRYKNLDYDPAQILARMIAKKIQELLQTQEYHPSDFLILVRKRDQLTQNIIKEFKKLHLPINGIDRINLNSSLAIQDLMSIANFVLLHQDDYNIACLLKSPIFNASEEDIFELSTSEGSIWDNIQTSKKYEQYHTILQNFIDLNLKHSPFDLFITILDILSYRKNFIQYFGHQINEILDEFLNICQTFQKKENSLASFIHWFNNSNLEIKRDIFANKNEIRLMTVHASKGLQARYVILPDTVSVPINKTPILFDHSKNIFIYKTDPLQNISPLCAELIENSNEKTLKEYYRLLYVALTRAQQHLLICGWSNKQSIPETSWFSLINKTLKIKKPLPTLMGYENININSKTAPLNDNFFFSNSESIYYIKKSNKISKNTKYELEEENVQLPDFLKSSVKDIPSILILNPSNISSQKAKIDSYPFLGTILHKALEIFVTQKEIDTLALEEYLRNNLIDNHKKYSEALKKIINEIIFPQIKNAKIKKEAKLYKKYSSKFEISSKIDLLIIKENEVLVIDYKTSIINEIPESIYQQLAIYFDLISEIYPDKKIICKVISIMTQKEFILDPELIQNTINTLQIKFEELA